MSNTSREETIIIVALTEQERVMLEGLLPQIPDIIEGTKEEISALQRIIDGLLFKIRTEEAKR